jgi:hypothetical protein
MLKNKIPPPFLMRRRPVGRLLLALAIVLVAQGASAQLSYSSGQNVTPAYEGWEREADGTRYFLFGYMNRNWLEEIDVEVGALNSISPGPADQGQPTHFLPRRNRFVFRVPVPSNFGDSDELVWTLRTKGSSQSAYATLRQDYFVDGLVQASEQGAIGAGSSNPTIRANKAPELEIEGEATRSVRVGQPLELVAVAIDDGVPAALGQTPISTELIFAARGKRELPPDPRWMPHQHVTVGSATGLRLSWYVYRGSGEVGFDPLQTKVWEDTRTGANSPWAPMWQVPPLPPGDRFVAHATFKEPGTYVLRCLASDGALGTDGDVTVTVTP